MEILDCLCIKHEPDEKDDIERVLSITKSVMAITMPMPTVNWNVQDDKLFIFGSEQEIGVVKIVLQNNLGLFKSETNPFDIPQYRYAVPRLSGDQGVGLREVSEGSGVPTTFVVPQRVMLSPDVYADAFRHTPSPLEEDVPFEDNRSSVVDYSALFNRPQTMLGDNDEAPNPDPNLMSALDLDELESGSGLNSRGEPDYRRRADNVNRATSMCAIWTGSTVIDEDTNARWLEVSNRLSENPDPTESASGSYTREEQIAFSETHNPAHWNIVKATFGGSRYYLSYICPPSTNMYDSLRIVGGIHAEDTPEIQEICIYNTESYWRELRHMMHQGVETVYEAVRAA